MSSGPALLKRFVRKTTRANMFCWRWSLAVRDFDMPYMIGVGVVKSGARQSVSNQSGGVGIEDGTNVAKSSNVVLTGLAYQSYMLVESKRLINGSAQ